MFNQSDVTFQSGTHPLPRETNEEQPVNMDMEKNKEKEWITVQRTKCRRFHAVINGIHVKGDNEMQKEKNLTTRLAVTKGFIECKKQTFNKDLHFKAIFETKEDAQAACQLELFEDNEHYLTLQPNKGDNDTLERSLVIRDLPLDLDKNLLKLIIEEKFGQIDSLTTRLAGPWYRADVMLKSKDNIEENIDMWAIQYKKELCRIAPAYFSREQINQRNEFTLKLTNLPYGTTPIDLKPILLEFKCKTCFIPRIRNRYTRQRYAYVTFENEDDVTNAASNSEFYFGNTTLVWENPDTKTCHKCGSTAHLVVDCQERAMAEQNKERRKQYSNIYSRYHVPNYRKITQNYKRNSTASWDDQKNRQERMNQNKDSNGGKSILSQLKEMQMKMEEGFAQINKDLNEVKEKIKKLEDQQIPINKMDKRSFANRTTFKGLHNSSFSKYIPTVKASEEFFEEREKEKQAQKAKLNQTLSETDISQDKSSSVTKTQENKSKHDNKRQRMYNTSDSSDSGDNSRTNNSSKKIIHSSLKDNKGKQVSFDTPSN